MSSRSRVITLIAAGTALLLMAAAALAVVLSRPKEAARPDPVAATVPIALQAEGLPKDVSIGVVLSLGRSGEAGSEYSQAAQGAVVAAQRFAQGGTPIALRAENDKGTEDGARAAVQSLSGQQVSGVVITTTGVQARAAAQAAADLGLPAILPYSEPAAAAPAVWTTGPTAAAVNTALQRALAGKNKVLHVEDGAAAPASVPRAQTLRLGNFADLHAMAQEAAVQTGDQPQRRAEGAPDSVEPSRVASPADAVVVSAATPQRLARIVQALQSRDVSVPLILPPGASAPMFASTLAKLDGTASGQLVTVAFAGDATALQQDAQGRGMSAFLSAVRLAAGDTAVLNLVGDAPFAADAWAADPRSHDAVLALARAAALARSSQPEKVSAALGTMTLGPGEGLAGPALDFSNPAALTAPALPAFASAQDLGLRPADENAPHLVWVPATKGS